MVHISEVSNDFIEDLDTVLSDGQDVKVKIINIAEDGKIALSIKRTLPSAAVRAHRARQATAAALRARPAAKPPVCGSPRHRRCRRAA